ncbi:MAG: hypothetical protein NTZ67_06435 [Gammaproteobacteria bacterium]|nr:hypothetical protein [Gammaproteobacteria bacterium]
MRKKIQPISEQQLMWRNVTLALAHKNAELLIESLGNYLSIFELTTKNREDLKKNVAWEISKMTEEAFNAMIIKASERRTVNENAKKKENPEPAIKPYEVGPVHALESRIRNNIATVNYQHANTGNKSIHNNLLQILLLDVALCILHLQGESLKEQFKKTLVQILKTPHCSDETKIKILEKTGGDLEYISHAVENPKASLALLQKATELIIEKNDFKANDNILAILGRIAEKENCDGMLLEKMRSYIEKLKLNDSENETKESVAKKIESNIRYCETPKKSFLNSEKFNVACISLGIEAEILSHTQKKAVAHFFYCEHPNKSQKGFLSPYEKLVQIVKNTSKLKCPIDQSALTANRASYREFHKKLQEKITNVITKYIKSAQSMSLTLLLGSHDTTIQKILSATELINKINKSKTPDEIYALLEAEKSKNLALEYKAHPDFAKKHAAWENSPGSNKEPTRKNRYGEALAKCNEMLEKAFSTQPQSVPRIP